MTIIHILRRKADEYIKLWCPYCDEIVDFGVQYYYGDAWCTKCNRVFSSYWRHCKWPKGLDIKTGELIKEDNA
jgi:hypothetical protein